MSPPIERLMMFYREKRGTARRKVICDAGSLRKWGGMMPGSVCACQLAVSQTGEWCLYSGEE